MGEGVNSEAQCNQANVVAPSRHICIFFCAREKKVVEELVWNVRLDPREGRNVSGNLSLTSALLAGVGNSQMCDGGFPQETKGKTNWGQMSNDGIMPSQV